MQPEPIVPQEPLTEEELKAAERYWRSVSNSIQWPRTKEDKSERGDR